MDTNVLSENAPADERTAEEVAAAAREAVRRELLTVSHTHESAAQAAYDAVLSALSV